MCDGSLPIGKTVILGRHDNIELWFPEMEQHVGKKTTITRYVGLDYYGFERYNVAIDDGKSCWRACNMTLLPNSCRECGDTEDAFVVHVDGRCAICRRWREVLT